MALALAVALAVALDYLEVDLIAHTLSLLHYSERLEVCGGSVEVFLEVDLIAFSYPLVHF